MIKHELDEKVVNPSGEIVENGSEQTIIDTCPNRPEEEITPIVMKIGPERQHEL